MVETITKSISNQLLEDWNSRKIKVCSANKKNSNKNSIHPNNSNSGTLNPVLLLQRTKKSKNLKTPKV